MVEKVFAAVTRFGKKHNLESNILFKGFIPAYHCFQRFAVSRVKAGAGSASSAFEAAQLDNFLAENADRVERVAGMLADEKSQKTYLGIVKFRQTGLKRDFPLAWYEKKQYFISELRLGKNEVFVDCGAFNGDTIDGFIKHCGKYKAVIAFEPDLNNFAKLQKKYGYNPKIILIDAGVYDRDGEVRFDVQKSGVSRIAGETSVEESEVNKIRVQSIDSLAMRDEITFIKMDVEGAELNALKGAEQTILRNKPKLAICIYHNNKDMIAIAEYIHELVPEYKLYVRQHMLFPSCAETVLYAAMP